MLTVTGTTNYHIKQHITMDIDQVLQRSRRGILTGS